MAGRAARRRSSPDHEARAGRGAPTPLPTGPVPIDSGTAELQSDRSDPRAVTLLVNDVPSSYIDLDDPARLDFEYMQQMAALIDQLPPGPLAAVHLGAGGCAMPRWLDVVRPGSRQLAVDIDARLLTLVRGWFGLPRSPALRLRPGEARAVLAQLPDASADLLIRDVFDGASTPGHLCTAEFLADVRRVLRPGGLYLANCADRPPLALARAEGSTAQAVFVDVAVVAEPAQLKGRRYGNIVVAARTEGAGPDLGAAPLARSLRSLAVPARLLHGAELRTFVGRAPVLLDAAPGDDEAAPTPVDAASTGPSAGLRAAGRSQPGGPWGPA